tara:strand:+ start:12119 stop:12370 length:252 start_codon:yes stop_codon:yes gene_type:complete
MLDETMRHQPKGHKFFAKANSVDRQGKLYALGLRKGDLVLCHMLNSNNENPLVDVTIGGKTLTISDKTEYYYTWLVYKGEESV